MTGAGGSAGTVDRPDLLETIVAGVRRSVETRRAAEPLSVLTARAASRTPRADLFKRMLSQPDRVNVIAECKRRSPARGLLCRDYDPAAIARTYEQGGAAAVSVLTEPTFFDGTLAHLQEVRAAIELPVLRKDFVVDPYQVLEARAAGADAVLLVARLLPGRQLADLAGHVRSAGLATLVEVHDRAELARAVDCGAEIVGVNNRNLGTLVVDLAVGASLIGYVPGDVVAVAESGLRTADDIAALRRLGYRAFLVGEHLMSSDDPRSAVAALVGQTPGGARHG